MNQKTSIPVGEKKTFKTGFLTSVTVIYCGMPSDNVYSIGYLESSGYRGYSLNLYYPVSYGTLKLQGTEFRIWEVTKEQITLEQIG